MPAIRDLAGRVVAEEGMRVSLPSPAPRQSAAAEADLSAVRKAAEEVRKRRERGEASVDVEPVWDRSNEDPRVDAPVRRPMALPPELAATLASMTATMQTISDSMSQLQAQVTQFQQRSALDAERLARLEVIERAVKG